MTLFLRIMMAADSLLKTYNARSLERYAQKNSNVDTCNWISGDHLILS